MKELVKEIEEMKIDVEDIFDDEEEDGNEEFG